MKSFLILLNITITSLCFSQELSIEISDNNYAKDEFQALMLCQIQNIDTYADLTNYDQISISIGLIEYNFVNSPALISYQQSYLVEDITHNKLYTLYFTPLPIISIDSDSTIVDEPKVLANFSYSDSHQTFDSKIGIEIRGGLSQTFPKKTYDLEFWEDNDGEDTYDVQFDDLREDDDWILDALYNEPLRMRSYIANKLWKNMHIPYYHEEEPSAKSGADVMYVEMFLNGSYNGIYNLSEQVDRKQLKLKKFNGNIRGELYKGESWGAATFTDLPDIQNDNKLWGGYALKYPDDDDTIQWRNLYQFTDFVINSSTTDFSDSIWTKFEKENFIDYFLFLNLLRATDNTGKNIYLAKYNTDEPYYYVPWDLDGCFGTIWDGSEENITNDLLTNGFISRVLNENPDSSLHKIANTWFNYRSGIFNYDSLANQFTSQFNFFQNNKIYERESLVYPNYTFDNAQLTYSLNWLDQRLRYLDDYFDNLLSNDKLVKIPNITIYPNPASYKVYLKTLTSIYDTPYSIYDNTGLHMYSGTINNNYIDITDLNQGFYFILVSGVPIKFVKN